MELEGERLAADVDRARARGVDHGAGQAEIAGAQHAVLHAEAHGAGIEFRDGFAGTAAAQEGGDAAAGLAQNRRPERGRCRARTEPLPESERMMASGEAPLAVTSSVTVPVASTRSTFAAATSRGADGDGREREAIGEDRCRAGGIDGDIGPGRPAIEAHVIDMHGGTAVRERDGERGAAQLELAHIERADIELQVPGKELEQRERERRFAPARLRGAGDARGAPGRGAWPR